MLKNITDLQLFYYWTALPLAFILILLLDAFFNSTSTGNLIEWST